MWGMGGWVCCVGRWVGGMLKDDITEVIIMLHWIVGVARYSHYTRMIHGTLSAFVNIPNIHHCTNIPILR